MEQIEIVPFPSREDVVRLGEINTLFKLFETPCFAGMEPHPDGEFKPFVVRHWEQAPDGVWYIWSRWRFETADEAYKHGKVHIPLYDKMGRKIAQKRIAHSGNRA